MAVWLGFVNLSFFCNRVTFTLEKEFTFADRSRIATAKSVMVVSMTNSLQKYDFTFVIIIYRSNCVAAANLEFRIKTIDGPL